MLLRIRLPELLAEHGLTTYQIAKRSGGRISMSTAYRLKASNGRMETYSSVLLDALCEIFGLTDTSTLFELDTPKRRRGKAA